jgi:hypothetical protein
MQLIKKLNPNSFEKTKAGGLFSFLVKLHCNKIEARNKACFLPHVSGMCLISSASKLCNNLF